MPRVLALKVVECLKDPAAERSLGFFAALIIWINRRYPHLDPWEYLVKEDVILGFAYGHIVAYGTVDGVDRRPEGPDGDTQAESAGLV